MDSAREPGFERIHALASGTLEGTLSRAEIAEFQRILVEDKVARRVYLQHVQESAGLRWLCAEASDGFVEPAEVRSHVTSGPNRRRRYEAWIGAVAMLVMIGLFVGNQFIRIRSVATPNANSPSVPNNTALATANRSGNRPSTSGNMSATARAVVATVTALNEARWAAPSADVKMLSRFAIGDRLQLRGGSAVLTFDAGAQVTVFGPAVFEITSATSIRCQRGRVTTLVDERGRGFSIETPKAKVVDLGTQFGLSIADDGETEVVVFQGMIDLSPSGQTDGDSLRRRMRQGEALLVNHLGQLERITAVERNSFLQTFDGKGDQFDEPVIGDVHDNIRSADSPVKSYQIVHGGVEDDCLAFVDRGHQWNGLEADGLPAFLAGADYIMPFNDDKFVNSLELTVKLLRPATLYIFVDNNMTPPTWLTDQFTDTGVDIGLDCSKTQWHKQHSLGVGAGRSIDFSFSVWQREVQQAGTVTLGSLKPPADRTQGFNMYGIAAVARESATPAAHAGK